MGQAMIDSTIEDLTIRPHQVMSSWESGNDLLVSFGYVRTAHRGNRTYYERNGVEWALVTWPTGRVTLEWPEQEE